VKDTDVNLYRESRLREEFGPFGEAGPDGIALTTQDIVGETYRRVLAETTAIVAHQWRNEIAHSVLKGFLFYGDVGMGKTTMGRRLAYELSRMFGGNVVAHEHEGGTEGRNLGLTSKSLHLHSHGDGLEHERPAGDDVVLVIVDGADIARGRYGDSEEQLQKLFRFAREGEFHGHVHEDDPVRRTVLLFDDVESLFLTRSSGGAKEWHFSQNSVFFHAIDELDTAHTVVILTTNRLDLVDEAIIDRFLPYEFEALSLEVLEQVARHRALVQQLDEAHLAPVLAAIKNPAQCIKSIRQVERMVARAYVRSIVGITAARFPTARDERAIMGDAELFRVRARPHVDQSRE
jgi:AAA+ superfamily predicted ATPase